MFKCLRIGIFQKFGDKVNNLFSRVPNKVSDGYLSEKKKTLIYQKEKQLQSNVQHK